MLPFLKRHYEKLILAVLLTVFILLLALQIMMLQETKNIEVKEYENYTPPNANYQKQAANFNAEKTLSSFVKWTPRTEKAKNTAVTDFVVPYRITICPECRKAIPEINFTVPRTDGKLYCSLNGHVLQPPMIIVSEERETDSDKDGIPDKYEDSYKQFSKNDPSDAALDFDNDFFTNLEEYICDTDPFNPKLSTADKNALNASRFPGRLPYHLLLEVASIKRREYSFKLLSVQANDIKPDPKTTRFFVEIQIADISGGNLRYRKRQKVFKVGEQIKSLIDTVVVTDLVVKPRNPENKNLGNEYFMKIRDLVSGEIFEVARNEKVVSPVPVVAFRSRLLKEDLKAKPGEKIRLGNGSTGIDEYTLVDADEKNTSVRLRDSAGKTFAVGRRMMLHATLDAMKKAKKNAPAKQGTKPRE